MEHHIDLAGTPFEVQLGLLGSTLAPSVGCFEAGPPLQATAYAYRDILGCASSRFDSPRAETMITQPFERGTMVWVNGIGRRSGAGIYTIFFDQTTGQLTERFFEDQYRSGATVEIAGTPPEGLHAPVRGFGKVWAENESVRNTLGWATTPEYQFDGIYYNFENGAIVYRSDVDRVYIIMHDGRVEDIQRIP